MVRHNKLMHLAEVGWVLVWAGVEQTAGAGQLDDVQSGPDADVPMVSDVGRGTDTAVVGLTDVFFEFDNARLSPEARRSLELTAQWLRESPTRRVVIEGHADERGTNEYNLALGERDRRAPASNHRVRRGTAVLP